MCPNIIHRTDSSDLLPKNECFTKLCQIVEQHEGSINILITGNTIEINDRYANVVLYTTTDTIKMTAADIHPNLAKSNIPDTISHNIVLNFPPLQDTHRQAHRFLPFVISGVKNLDVSNILTMMAMYIYKDKYDTIDLADKPRLHFGNKTEGLRSLISKTFLNKTPDGQTIYLTPRYLLNSSLLLYGLKGEPLETLNLKEIGMGWKIQQREELDGIRFENHESELGLRTEVIISYAANTEGIYINHYTPDGKTKEKFYYLDDVNYPYIAILQGKRNKYIMYIIEKEGDKLSVRAFHINKKELEKFVSDNTDS